MPIRPEDVARFLALSGWSQARLAWTLGINQPRISRFLTGLKNPNGPTRDALEAFFAADALARTLIAAQADAVGPGRFAAKRRSVQGMRDGTTP